MKTQESYPTVETCQKRNARRIFYICYMTLSFIALIVHATDVQQSSCPSFLTCICSRIVFLCFCTCILACTWNQFYTKLFTTSFCCFPLGRVEAQKLNNEQTITTLPPPQTLPCSWVQNVLKAIIPLYKFPLFTEKLFNFQHKISYQKLPCSLGK